MLTFQDEAEMRKHGFVIDPCDPSKAVPIGQLTDRQQAGTFIETTERHLERNSGRGASRPANDETSQLWKNSEPDESWDLGRLANFIRRCLRRTAEDTWWIGRALALARKQLTDERKWLRWLAKLGIGKSSAYRFCTLSRGYTLEQIQARPGVAVDRLLKELKSDEAVGGKKKKTTAGNSTNHSTAKTAARKSADTDSAEENGQEISVENSEEPADREEEQLPITDAEYEAMRNFVQVCGGWTRAEYVLSEYRQEAPSEEDDQAGAEVNNE